MSARDTFFPSGLRRRLANVLLSRPVGLLAGTAFLSIIFGCMSLSFGGLSIGCRTEPDGTVCQEGKATLRPGQELDVYYPAPYASPPNLELSGDTEHCEVIEQKADHFRIRYRGSSEACPHWQARGLRGAPPVSTVIVSPPGPPAVVPPPDTTTGPPTLPAPKPEPNL